VRSWDETGCKVSAYRPLGWAVLARPFGVCVKADLVALWRRSMSAEAVDSQGRRS
jgi:hypothetical protein